MHNALNLDENVDAVKLASRLRISADVQNLSFKILKKFEENTLVPSPKSVTGKALNL